MAHAHAHDHGRAASRRRLAWTLALVLFYMVAEAVGGWWTGSLALLADAGHMLSDAASLGLALFALWMAARPSGPERTFGHHRTEILAALVNGVTLVVVAVFVVLEAWERFAEPTAVRGLAMTAIATGGLAVNLAGMAILHGSRDESLNVRGAWLHVAADTLGSVQAIVAGLLVWRLGWTWADPAASVLIALLVVGSAFSLLRESVNVLMEASPGHIDPREVEGAIAGVAGVEGVHDLHVWTITSGFESLSVHARVVGRDHDEVLGEVREIVLDRFGIDHATVQLEGEEGCRNLRCG